MKRLLVLSTVCIFHVKAFDATKWPEVKKYCQQHSPHPKNFPMYQKKFIKSGNFPTDEGFQCYLACLAIRSEMLILGDDLTINWRKLKPCFVNERAYECQKQITEQDPCEKAYVYFDCLRKGNTVFQSIGLF